LRRRECWSSGFNLFSKGGLSVFFFYYRRGFKCRRGPRRDLFGFSARGLDPRAGGKGIARRRGTGFFVFSNNVFCFNLLSSVANELFFGITFRPPPPRFFWLAAAGSIKPAPPAAHG